MLGLIVVGIVAGFLAGISPCILPVLPVVLVAGASPPASTGPPGTPDAARREPSRGRSLAVIGGLVLSFSVIVLAGSELLSLLHLPQDALRDAGIALLIVVGLGYLIPPLGTLLERPFARLGARQPNGRAGGFVLGLAVGVVYVPCAGPVLAAITVVGATHRVGLTAIILTAAFAAGTAVPLLAVAVAGGQLTSRIGAIRRRAPQLRRAGGAVLIVMAVLIASDVLAGLQRDIPGYTTALQGSPTIRKQLNALTGTPHTSLAKCDSTATTLVNCGRAPTFTGITTWLNTPGGQPLSLSALRGKVVLVDFWTYSCINCQRTLPHVEAWYSEVRQGRLRRRGRAHPRVRLRARRLQRAGPGRGARGAVPGGHRQRLRHLERLQQPVLAGRLPDRRPGQRPLGALRRGRLLDHGTADPPAPPGGPPQHGRGDPGRRAGQDPGRADEPRDLRRLRRAPVPRPARGGPRHAR